MTKFLSRHFSVVYVPRDLGVSKNSLKNHFEVKLTPWQRIEKIFFFALILIPSFLGYLFVPCPLGDIKRVSGEVFGSTDLIGSF